MSFNEAHTHIPFDIAAFQGAYAKLDLVGHSCTALMLQLCYNGFRGLPLCRIDYMVYDRDAKVYEDHLFQKTSKWPQHGIMVRLPFSTISQCSGCMLTSSRVALILSRTMVVAEMVTTTVYT